MTPPKSPSGSVFKVSNLHCCKLYLVYVKSMFRIGSLRLRKLDYIFPHENGLQEKTPIIVSKPWAIPDAYPSIIF